MVSALSVVADDNHISDIDEEDFPSASEIDASQNVITPLGDMLSSQAALPPFLAIIRTPHMFRVPHIYPLGPLKGYLVRY